MDQSKLNKQHKRISELMLQEFNRAAAMNKGQADNDFLEQTFHSFIWIYGHMIANFIEPSEQSQFFMQQIERLNDGVVSGNKAMGGQQNNLVIEIGKRI